MPIVFYHTKTHTTKSSRNYQSPSPTKSQPIKKTPQHGHQSYLTPTPFVIASAARQSQLLRNHVLSIYYSLPYFIPNEKNAATRPQIQVSPRSKIGGSSPATMCINTTKQKPSQAIGRKIIQPSVVTGGYRFKNKRRRRIQFRLALGSTPGIAVILPLSDR